MGQSNVSKKEVLSKADVISLVADNMSLSKADVERVVDNLFSTIESQMAQGKDIRVYGFGVFSVQKREERSAFNPKTREKIQVPAQWVPKFRPMAALKNSVNQS